MTTIPRNPSTDKPARKTITLSPAALAILCPPLVVHGSAIYAGNERELGTIFVIGGSFNAESEIAAFIADLVNEALTPAALPDESDPRFQLLMAAAALEPENNAELRQAVSE